MEIDMNCSTYSDEPAPTYEELMRNIRIFNYKLNPYTRYWDLYYQSHYGLVVRYPDAYCLIVPGA